MTARSITVLKPGLETTVQELPGRIGYLEQGFPVSGPFDKWSFRQANLLVGNPRDTAALECQLLGPTLRFEGDAAVAVTGADMRPKLDGQPVPMWQTLHVRAGQVLEIGAAYSGARGYVAVAGGIDTPVVLLVSTWLACSHHHPAAPSAANQIVISGEGLPTHAECTMV